LWASLEAQSYRDYLVFDLSVVRGLAYYTGIVFEVFDKGNGLRALAGGGRYDSLMANLGGEPVSAVGFGMGDVVLAELLKEKNLLPQGRPGVDYYFADLVSEDLPRQGLLALAQRLRTRGVSVAYALKPGKFKKQMEEANDAGAKRVLFFGSDRAPEGSYEVKDLMTGEQKVIEEGEL
jgi:histidyl-tRNA synthetase